MLKGKKVFIITAVIVLLLAMATTVYAASSHCYLSLGETGWESTSSLYTYYARSVGCNSQYSSEDMGMKMQYKYDGEYYRLASWSLPVDTWGVSSGTQNVGFTTYWRTKIYSPTGNVEGNGTIYDY